MARTVTQMTTVSVTPLEPPKPALCMCRQSVEADLPGIEALQTLFTAEMFGEVNLKRCIEKRVCRTLVNVDNEVVAFIVVVDHPNVPAIAYCNWVGWIRRFYRVDFATPWNSLFIHYLVWDDRYPDFLKHFLKSLYKNDVKLTQVMMITPPYMEMFGELDELFTVIYPKSEGVLGSALTQFQNLYMNLRYKLVSKLTVRKAGEEDNIDVQPLVHHQMEVLKYVFGDIKLGTIIDLKNPTKAILVAEKGTSTVGVLTASSKVDYNSINIFFHHLLDSSSRRDSVVDRLCRMDTVRSELRRGLPFTPETMSAEEQLSIELNMEHKLQSVEEESLDEDEERDELVVYWDEDGDMFRVVDPVMEYLLHAKQQGSAVSEMARDDSSACHKDSTTSQQTVDYTYWGRQSWSNSAMQLTRDGSIVTRERGGTVSCKDHTTFVPVDNAFTITLFALHPDLDVRYAFDLLEVSFECFPERNFCLLPLPTAYQGSPLTKHMVRMAPKMTSDFPHELYFTHRNAVFSVFTVRPVEFVDHVGITELVENVSQFKKISKDVVKIFLQESPTVKGFVLECEGNIVGVAVINTNFRLHQLQPHYKLEEQVKLKYYDNESHGLIRHLVLCPIFLKSGPFFLKQIMHQTGLETLSYCLLHDDIITVMHADVSPITVLVDMVPVRPRRRIEYELSALDDFKPQDFVLQQDYEFALFIATEKILSTPKVELNYRIIVVGGSDTAMSFLENLVFNAAKKHIIYNNLVLVSIHGFPLELRPHMAGDKMIPHGGVYTREYLDRISLTTHVNVLYGALTIINRKEKTICLNEDHWLRYDYLVLTTGMQFCKPWPALDFPSVRHGSTGQTQSCTTAESDSCLRDDRDYPQQDCRKNEDIRELYQRASEHYAENLFVINTSADAVIALGHLKKYFKHKKEGKILIHGFGLNTYTCVESLMLFGVPGHKIVVVTMARPTLGHWTLQTNPFVENAVLQTMEEAGVTIHKDYSLICWSLRHKYLDKVMFRNDDNIPMTLDCVALFCFGAKSTNAKTYLAVNDAGIVYNNGIIIDNQFRTNDMYIYAAGPGTRYSNRYSPAFYQHHKYFSSVEIGRVLSETIGRLLEPKTEEFYLQELHESEERDALLGSLASNVSETLSYKPEPSLPTDFLPDLTEPVTWVAQLPGGWRYVKVTAPGRPIPLECQFNGQGDRGPILITGVPINPEGPGYFQLSFSVYNTVCEIVLLSKKNIPYQNLRQLYGKHERLLNNVYEQYNQGLISDFYSFFSQPWAYALYTSRFGELFRQCAEIFFNSESVGLPQLLEMNRDEIDWKMRRLRHAEQEAINARYLSSSVPMYVEHLVLKFITDRSLQLPMYFTDAVLAASSHASSPLHRDPVKLRQRTVRKSSRRESHNGQSER